MKIADKMMSNMQNRRKTDSMLEIPFLYSQSSSVSFNNNSFNNKKRPLEQNSKNLSFKGLSPKEIKPETITKKAALEAFDKAFGKTAKENLEKVIDKIMNKDNPLVKVDGENITILDQTKRSKLYKATIDPIIHFPVDIVNSAIGFLQRAQIFKDSKLLNNILDMKPFKARRESQELFSNTLALQHLAETLSEHGNVTKGGLRRFGKDVSDYTSKSERALTRVFSGVVPAFFLANDAYNLSMYVNNDKDLAKKEKKRRFNQEIARVGITAAATFAALGYFAKQSNRDPKTATMLIAAVTLVSEIIGRAMVGTPFYPITVDGAKKYAKIQNKKKSAKFDKELKEQDTVETSSTKANNLLNTKNIDAKDSKDKPKKSNNALKLIGGLIAAGFLIERAPYSIKPIRKLVSNLRSRYNSIFAKTSGVKKEEFQEFIKTLKDNGFNKVAKRFEDLAKKTLDEGNLTAKDKILFDREIDKLVEEKLPNIKFLDEETLKKEREKIIKENISKEQRENILKRLNIESKKDSNYININLEQSKIKRTIIHDILGFPIKLAHEIIMLPYKYIVRPAIELPIKGISNLFSKEKIKPEPPKPPTDQDNFKFLWKYIQKNGKSANFKADFSKKIIDAFDNVSKSNFSNAELGGTAKTAVSAVTSAFLIFDNYNMVMIDSQGEDKKLAGQKARERTVQRIFRIAYGAALIKLFGTVFKPQYNSSLVGAQAVNVAQSMVCESLERVSVGLPLHEATRDEIVEKDNNNINATGIKGAYFKAMSKLTGKKPLSKTKSDK